MFTIMMAFAAASTPASPAVPTDLSAWVAQVNEQLQAHLHYPSGDSTGLATVSFRRDENGRPVEIMAKSGSRSLTQAAIRTVKAAGPLPPMPRAMPVGQRITFKFLVGSMENEEEFNRLRVRMLESANRTNMTIAARLASPTQVASLEHR